MDIVLLTLAGLVAGFIDAIAGGGGVITFPTFIFLGLPVSEIVSTNKLVSASGTTFAALTFLKKGHGQKEILLPALPFTFLGALCGAALVLILPNDFLKPVISILVISVALYCFFRPALGIHHNYKGLDQTKLFTVRLAALLIGLYDGFFGPGTGIFLTFFFIRYLECDFLRATANTKVLNWASNIISLTYFLFYGNIRYDIGIPMLIANIIGGYLGAHAAILKGSRFIKWIYLIMALLTAFKLINDLIHTFY